MNWDDLDGIWRGQEPPKGAEADVSELARTFEVRHRRQAVSVAVSHTAEAGAGVFVAIMMVPLAWHVGPFGWLIWLAVALILGVSAFFVSERLRTRRAHVGPEASILAQIDSDIAALRRRRRFVHNIVLWHLAPIGAAMALVFTALVLHAPAWNPLREPIVILGFSAFFTTALVFAWAINRRAMRKQIEPRIAELEKLRAQFTHNPPTP